MAQYYGIKSNSNYVIKDDGSLWQIGRNRLINPLVPVILDRNYWSQISSGDSNFAIQSDGTLWAWGQNGSGQLGTFDTTVRVTPVQIGTSLWKKVLVNQFGMSPYAVAIQSNGTLWSCGYNFFGNLGNNSTTNISSFVQIGSSVWKDISLGQSHTLALQSNGTLWTWGLNTQGQLGQISSDLTQKITPVPIGNPFVVTNLANSGNDFSGNGSGDHTLIIKSDGTMWGWGQNGSGQLGTSDTTLRSSPVQVATAFLWRQVSSGKYHTVAIQTNGNLYTWGLGGNGQIGNNGISSLSTPTLIGTNLWKQVSAGGQFNAAIRSDGTLWTWGINDYGQLGQSNTTNRSSPVQVGTSGLWKNVVCGYYNVFAIQSDGTLWSWGNNNNSSLGLNDLTNRSSPVQVGSALWKKISAALSHTLGIQSDGTLWAWGQNNSGQLGLGDIFGRYTPTQVGSINYWTEILGTGTSSASVAIQSDGTLWTWGSNAYNTLGTSEIVSQRSSPVQIGTSSWTKLSCGYRHVFAIQSDGSVWSWGLNSYGQLGTSNVTLRSTPTQIIYVENYWNNIAAGRFSSYGIKSNGTLWSWGYNLNGQLGLSDTTNRSSPVQIGTESYWSKIFSSGQQAFALQSNGILWSWGYNNVGQLGTSNITNRSSPVQVVSTSMTPIGSISLWKDIACGYSLTSGILSDGTLWSWGSNANGQLGIGSTIPGSASTPVRVGISNSWSKISLSYINSLSAGIKNDGTLWTWGATTVLGYPAISYRSDANRIGSSNAWVSFPIGSQNTSWGAVIDVSQTLYIFGDNPSYFANYKGAQPYYPENITYVDNESGSFIKTPLSLDNNVRQVSIGGGWGVYIKNDNSIWGWGNTSFGQIIDPTYTAFPHLAVFNQQPYKKISFGQFGVSILSDGTLWGWGQNDYGQLALGDTAARFSPIQIGVNLWSNIAAGFLHVTAIQSNNTLWSWGRNDFGQLGTGDTVNRSSPVFVVSDDNSLWSQSSTGLNWSLGIKSDGTLWAWGNNLYGQLGLTNNAINYSSAVQIGANLWSQVACGYLHSLGLQSDGTLWAWGLNSFGQLGTSDQLNRYSPTQIANNINDSWSQVASGYSFSLALTTNGYLYVWGVNSFGQLGTNDLTHRSNPVQVGARAWLEVSSSYINSFGIKDNGTLWVWGNNSYGQLGINTISGTQLTPIQLGTQLWKKIANNLGTEGGGLGISKSYLAIQSNGTLWAWGSNTYGGLGTFDTTHRSSPVQIGSNLWSNINTARNSTLGIQSDGTLWSWGRNSSGQLGLSDRTDRSSPVQVGTGLWKQTSIDSSHSAGIQSDGTLWTWGYNNTGELGLNDIIERISPVQVGLDVWSQVACGYQTTLAIQSNGTLWSWGRNPNGQLGLSDTTDRSSPVQVGTGLWKQIAAGNGFSLGIQSDGTLWTWGGNNQGQLGTSNTTTRYIPTQITSLNSWNKVSTGLGNAFAITSNGTLWAWGDNGSGVFGNNTTTGTNTSPINLGSVIKWSKINAGGQHTLAIQSGGNLWSWGNNLLGQLGTSDITDRLTPVQIGANLWKELAAGVYHSLAIQSDGTLWAWGMNSYGQLGQSNITNRSSPVQITGLWSQVACGQFNSFAINSKGTMWGTGENAGGQLGLSNTTSTLSPIQIFSSTGDLWKKIASEFSHVTAINSDGTLWTWGAGTSGQLGRLNQVNVSYPLKLGVISTDWAKLKNGYSQSAAIKSDGTLWSWGNNSYGQLGVSDVTHKFSPTQITSENNWKEIFLNGNYGTFAINSDGDLYAWGLNTFGVLGVNDSNVPAAPISKVIPTLVGNYGWSEIDGFNYNTTAYYSTASIQSNGKLWIWGNNSFGQLGFGDLSHRLSPTQLGFKSWKKISVGGPFMVAIQSNNTLWSWGANSYGQLGLSDFTHRSSPVQIGNDNLWTDTSAGDKHVLAIQSNGTLWGWGYNAQGALGQSNTTNRYSPVQVGSDLWTKIAASADASHGIQSDGTLWAWGNNVYGKLGNNSTFNRLIPSQIGTDLWSNVVSGQGHTLAIQSNGTLWSWGNNNYGQLGLSDTTNRSSPVQIGTNLWTQVSCGYAHTLAIQSNGTLWSWGYNVSGPLGLSDLTNRSSPVQVGTSSLWKKIGAGLYQSFAVDSSANLWVWGQNQFGGPLGLTNAGSYNSPIQIGFIFGHNIVDLACGYSHTLAIQSNGTLWGWGNNSYGQLGSLAAPGFRSTPVQIGVSLWKKIAAGQFYSLGIQSNGTLWAAGINSYGQLGQSDRASRSSFSQVGTSSWKEIYTSPYLPASLNNFVFALNSNNTLWSWGTPTLNLGRAPGTIYSPMQIASTSIWSQINAGTTHWLAIDISNALWAMGNNSWGQLGLNDVTHRSSPTRIGLLWTWSKIASGDTFSTAVRNDGTLWAWGNNSYGQLGQGDYTHRSSPVQVGTINRYTDVYTLSNTVVAELA